MESIRGWTTKIDGGIKVYEGSESEMNRIIKDLQNTESEQAKCEEEELRQKNLNRKWNLKLQQKVSYDKKEPEWSRKPEKESKLQKLPKLVIIKFKGMQTNWSWCWHCTGDQVLIPKKNVFIRKSQLV